jgi:Ca-activated chloride channel homolog
MTEWFLEPGRLWLLLVVVVALAAYVGVQYLRPRVAVRFSNLTLLDKVAPRRPGWRRHLVAGVFLVALSLLVVSVAQPVATERVPSERSTIMLAFDVSLSMAAEDISPNRFVAAQEGAKEFVDELPERLNIGLVAFAGTARLVVPPTQDHEEVSAAIDRLELDRATAIGDAVKLSLDVIADQGVGVEGGAPEAAIVLLSDGETTVGMPTEDSVVLAQEAGIAVSTIAYGTQGGQVLIDEEGDGVGQLVPVPVNVEELRMLAEETGGLAFTAETADELDRVYDQIGSTVGFDEEATEVGHRYVAVAIVLLLVAAGLSMRWFGRFL